jgi:hypothetical protein
VSHHVCVADLSVWFLTAEDALAWLDVPPPKAWMVEPRPVIAIPPPSAAEIAMLEEWTRLGISDVEREVWLEAGLRRSEASRAELCIRFQMKPEDLTTIVDGRTVIERLRSGETIGSVVARLRSASA